MGMYISSADFDIIHFIINTIILHLLSVTKQARELFRLTRLLFRLT